MPQNLGTYINDYDIPRKKDVDGAGGGSGLHVKIQKEQDYLYQVWYDDLDYDGAYEYFKTHADPPTGACSSVRNGNFYGRNFDWYYDNNAEFKVNVSAAGGRYASQGMAGGFSDLTESFVSSGAASDTYKLVPFKMYDGINECGLTANINVVPTDNGTNVSIPTSASEVEICGMMVIRYLLDHFDTAYKAVSYMQQHMTIYFTDDLHEHNYELHFMIADKTSTYIVEFVDNHAVVIDATTHPYMTNFIIDGVAFNDDGMVYTPETQTAERNAMTYNGITANGSGLERYNLIVGNYATANTKAGMMSLMSQLTYSRAYTTSEDPSEPYWYTEFVGNYDTFTLNCASQPSAFASVIATAGQYYLDRDRDVSNTWQTTHSVVYDISKCEMTLIVQESQTQHVYMLERTTFTPEEWAAIQSGITESKVGAYDEHIVNNIIHITNSERQNWNSKQDAIPANTYDSYGAADTAVVAHNNSPTAHSSLFDSKADKFTTYTKTEVDAALDEKQDTIPTNTFDAYGAAATVQTNLNAVTAKIPTQASSTNQLADKDFVNSSIENVAAYFITKDAMGNPFATRAELSAATVFYSGGVVRVPTRNDYTVVLADESKTISATGEKPTTRYLYDSGWQYQYIVNNSGLTAAQWAAANSGITATKVGSYDTHIVNSDIHVTAAQKAEWDAKSGFSGNYNDLTNKPTIPTTLAQLAGDATHRTVTDTEKSTWSGKQDTIPSNTYDVYGAATSAVSTHNSNSSAHSSLFGNKVDKVSGKGLSTNDYTTAEKNKLAGIETGANKTTIDATLATSGAAADAKAVGDALAFVADFKGISGAGLHNSIYRGKYLGSTLTAAQSAAIRAGTFDGLWIGDYWTIGGVNYRVADFDYYLHSGDTELTTHHAVITTDTCLYNAQMNSTNTTAGSYANSAMRTSNLNSAKSTITAAFGSSHILSHRELLSNAVSNGSSSGFAWYDSTVELLSEHMVYGSHAWGGGLHIGYDTGNSKSQLAIFRLRHDYEHIRYNWYWLRDVSSATIYCGVDGYGGAYLSGASASGGVRPVFLIY